MVKAGTKIRGMVPALRTTPPTLHGLRRFRNFVDPGARWRPAHAELTMHRPLLPFLAFNGAPPQDLNALMAFDRGVFETRPALNAFCRPLCAADGPEGKATERGAPIDLRTAQNAFWAQVRGMNAVLVARLRRGHVGPRSRRFCALNMDLTRAGLVLFRDYNEDPIVAALRAAQE